MPWILVTLSTSSKCTVARSSASALALPRFHDRTGVAFTWDVRSAITPPPFCFRDTMSSLLQLHQNPWQTLIKIWIDTTYSFSTHKVLPASPLAFMLLGVSRWSGQLVPFLDVQKGWPLEALEPWDSITSTLKNIMPYRISNNTISFRLCISSPMYVYIYFYIYRHIYTVYIGKYIYIGRYIYIFIGRDIYIYEYVYTYIHIYICHM